MAKGTLNIVDMALLRHLRENSREHLTEISRAYGIPVTTLVAALVRVKANFVTNLTTLVDLSKLGFGIKAGFVIAVKDKKAKRELEKHLLSSINTNNVLRLGGEYDFLVDAFFRDVKELYLFEEELRGFNIAKFEQIHFVEELACEKFVP